MKRKLARVASVGLMVVGVSSFSGYNLIAYAANSSTTQSSLLPTVITPTQDLSNFHALTASASELQRFHFPARPTNPSRLAEWEKIMGNLKTYVAPVQIPSTTTHEQTSNWAGYDVQGQNNGGTGVYYTDTNAYWIQPTYAVDGTSDPSFWVGQGGDSNVGGYDIVQAGADSGAENAGGTTQYEFWVENWPKGTMWQAKPSVSPGDTVYVDVNWANGEAWAILSDQTKGTWTQVPFSAPDTQNLNTADYINENVTPTNFDLWKDWGSVNFYSGQLSWYNGSNGNSGSGDMSSYNDTPVSMIYNQITYSSPSAVNSSTSGFTVYADSSQ